MLDPLLRGVKDRLLAPLAAGPPGRLHPNLITVAGFAIGLGSALALLRQAYAWALALWLLCRVVDGLDGVVARERGKQSDLGGYLDILLDFVLYALLPIALVLGRDARPDSLFLSLSALLASFLVNAASWMYLSAILEKRAVGALARGEQTSVAMPTGLVEGTETILLFSLFLLLPDRAAPLFTLMAALVAVNVAQRLVWAVRHL